MVGELSELPKDSGLWNKIDFLSKMLQEDLYDLGIITNNSYYDSDATIERWGVIYFDKNGVEFKTKITEYKKYCLSDKRDKNMPTNPLTVYRRKHKDISWLKIITP